MTRRLALAAAVLFGGVLLTSSTATAAPAPVKPTLTVHTVPLGGPTPGRLTCVVASTGGVDCDWAGVVRSTPAVSAGPR